MGSVYMKRGITRRGADGRRAELKDAREPTPVIATLSESFKHGNLDQSEKTYFVRQN